jgi:hypothetical protein
MLEGEADRMTKLSNRLHALQLIFTRNIQEGELDTIRDEIDCYFSQSNKIKPYIGFCFGRYDIVVDFMEDSANILCYRASTLQRQLSKMVKDKFGKENAVSSCLMLCREIANENETKNELDPDSPIRTYTFCKMEAKGSEFDKILKKINESLPELRLFWNSSSYSVILVSEGNKYSDVYSRVFNFWRMFDKDMRRSSTLSSVNIRKSCREEASDDIMAVTYFKMSRFQDLNLGSGSFKHLFPNETTVQLSGPLTTLGWFDECAYQRTRTLMEVKKNIFMLRNLNLGAVDYTATLMLIPKVRRIE